MAQVGLTGVEGFGQAPKSRSSPNTPRTQVTCSALWYPIWPLHGASRGTRKVSCLPLGATIQFLRQRVGWSFTISLPSSSVRCRESTCVLRRPSADQRRWRPPKFSSLWQGHCTQIKQARHPLNNKKLIENKTDDLKLPPDNVIAPSPSHQIRLSSDQKRRRHLRKATQIKQARLLR